MYVHMVGNTIYISSSGTYMYLPKNDAKELHLRLGLILGENKQKETDYGN